MPLAQGRARNHPHIEATTDSRSVAKRRRLSTSFEDCFMHNNFFLPAFTTWRNTDVIHHTDNLMDLFCFRTSNRPRKQFPVTIVDEFLNIWNWRNSIAHRDPNLWHAAQYAHAVTIPERRNEWRVCLCRTSEDKNYATSTVKDRRLTYHSQQWSLIELGFEADQRSNLVRQTAHKTAEITMQSISKTSDAHVQQSVKLDNCRTYKCCNLNPSAITLALLMYLH